MNLKTGKYSYIILLLLLGTLINYAQPVKIRFENIRTDDGLSNNHISHIFQDSKGFLWISTQDGINRYDGYGYKYYKHIPGDLNSLSDYAVNNIFEDAKGTFWISTRNGLNEFNPDTEKFIHHKPEKDNLNSISSEKIVTSCQDKSGSIWIGTRNGLNQYDPKTKKFIRYLNDPSDKRSLSYNYVTSVFVDSKGNLWVGTQLGLNKYNYQSKNLSVFFNNPEDPESISGNLITTIFEDSNGNIWIGTSKGLNKLVSLSNEKARFIVYKNSSDDKTTLGDNNISSIAEDSKGNLWIGTISGGVSVFNPQTKIFKSYTRIDEDKNSLIDNMIKTICVDNFDNVWIGSFQKGISKYSPTQERFKLFQPDFNSLPETKRISITSIYIDEDKIWLGTEEQGIKVYSKNNFPENINLLLEVTTETKPKGISSNHITSILKDSDGNFWIGTFGGGVNKYNPQNKTVETFRYKREDVNSLGNDFVHQIFEDSKGTIWVALGLGSLNRFDKSAKNFERFRFNPEKPDDTERPSSEEVTSIVEDDKGNLWLGTTTGGLNKFDPAKKVFTHFKHDQQNKNSISSNRINSVFKDSKGKIWIGTFSGGLNYYDEAAKSFVHFLEKDGLPSNTIQAVAEDSEGNLWLTTTNGISIFNPGDKSFKNFDESDGLQGREFNQRAIAKDNHSGILYFCGANGVNIYSGRSIVENKNLPGIVLTEFKIFGQPKLSKFPIDDSAKDQYERVIILDHDENVFSFEYASLDFTSPRRNLYKYKLEGFDKDWIDVRNKREVTYTNLDPGNYVFRVVGSNSDGYWNEKGLAISLIINPPFWKTWWANTIYILLASIGFFAVRRYELNRIKLRNELRQKEFESKKLQEVDEIKSRFFANISHEFRTPLTIILGSLEKLKTQLQKSTDDKDIVVMERNASRLLQLINQLLDLSRIESRNVKLNASENDLVKFLKRIAASFSSLANQKSISLTFNGIPIDDIHDNDPIFIFYDKKKLETVFYNLLSNAIKFSPNNASVDVSTFVSEDKVKINFLNTGIEIPSEKLNKVFDRFYQTDDSGTRNYEGTGIGLSLVKEYIELHKGNVEVNSQDNQTTFTVTLLTGKVHLSDSEIDFAEENILSPILPFASEQPILINSIDEIVGADKTIILVVEDNADLREMIKENLSHEYMIIEAENGNKGLRLAEDNIPDLIISDIMMPEMDGYELSRKIKTNEKTNHIPVILLTAKADTRDKLEGLETGADDYLIKPFNSEELKIRVKNLIKIRKQMREKYQSQMLIKPSEVVVPSSQKVFIDRLISLIEKNISNEKFSVEILADEIGLSRAQLHRKIKAITNQSPSEFIRNYRLQRAAELLKQDAGNIAEISYRVGFSSQAYFTKTFQEVYGQTPLDFKRQHIK